MTARGREIETLAQFDEVVARGDHLRHKVLQDLDLTGRRDALLAADVQQAVFLGCRFPDGVLNGLLQRGALVFPTLPDLPFDPYQARLYNAQDLYDGVLGGGSYASTLDARTYAWSRLRRSQRRLVSTLAASLHDHAISDALDDLFGVRVHVTRCVGVMGGHATLRGDETYRLAAELGALLAREGFTVATGGGPGAMEAANLGARLSADPRARARAVSAVASVPDFHQDITGWARVALQVVEDAPTDPVSLGIPTWFYGHEPPNVFATHIAKYFSNALREDVLLQRCRGGIIYLPGAAGTVQEVFQAATGNYYAADEAQVAPMVLLGRDHWNQQLPAWPLLQRLAEGRAMAPRVHVVDTPEEAVAALRR